MQDLDGKITGGTLPAVEWNEIPGEIQNVIEGLGIALSSGDLNQLGKAIAGYVANGNFYTDSGVANAYVLTKIGSKQSAQVYTDGFEASFIAGNVNSGASTVNIAGIGVKDIKLSGGLDPVSGDISNNVELRFDSNNDWFELLNPFSALPPFQIATLAKAIANTSLYNGATVILAERDAGKGGGSTWDVVLTADVTPNTYDVVISTGNPLLSFVIRKSQAMNANMLGAFQGDTAAICTPALQAYAVYCDANGVSFNVACSENETDDYNLDSVIEFTTNVSVFGIGAYMPRFITEDTGLFKWPSGAINVYVTRIRAGMAVRHTTVPNSHSAVEFPGNTGSRPFYNNVYDCFFDGFGININSEWAWEQRYRDNIMINCGTMVKARGASVNNHMTGNEGTGDGLAFDIGDSASQIEGWWIKNNLLDGFDQNVSMIGAAYNKINDNIFDHISGNSGIVIQSGTSTPAFGNHIKGNYIAFSNAANEGIRLLNNVASSVNTGSTIDDNEIFAYATHSVIRGILVDGSDEADNIVSRNKITALTYDIDIAATALTTTISDNYMYGPGFRTAANVFYHNNHGTMISSQALVRTIVGENTDYWVTGQPVSGTYQQNDKAWRIGAAIDGNNMVLIGWIRLTTGSNHVAGVDWAAMRVSHVSPAT